jgi:hypothetical protein
MRKLLVAVLFSLLAFQYAWAQANEPGHRWSIGIKGGGTSSVITRTNAPYSVEPPPRFRNIQGYTGGLVIQYFAESNFALQIEGIYVQKGWREIFAPPTENRVRDSLFYQVTLNYVELPIMAHGYIGKKNVRIFLDGGLYLSYLLSHDIRREVSITDEQITYHMRMQNANRLDLGIRGAGGFEVATKAGTFQLGVHLDYGLGSVLKRYQTTPDNTARSIPNMLQNLAIGITLGYFIEFGK